MTDWKPGSTDRSLNAHIGDMVTVEHAGTSVVSITGILREQRGNLWFIEGVPFNYQGVTVGGGQPFKCTRITCTHTSKDPS